VKNSIDTAKSVLLNAIKLLEDERMVNFLLVNSQMNRHDIQFLIKNLDYIKTVYECKLAKGFESPFEIDY
jgi:hypothetical protein